MDNNDNMYIEIIKDGRIISNIQLEWIQRLTLGKDKNNDYVCLHESISRHHLEL